MRKAIVIIALALAGSLSATAQTTDNMNRIEVCKQNYRILFGGEALTGQGTDPEMMDVLQKFIFGEVFQTGELTLKQREMITCITLATMQTLPQLKAHAGAALNVGVTPEELREVMYLTAPFIGFPKMLNAVGAVNEVFKERGISLPLEKQGTVTEETRQSHSGQALSRRYRLGDGRNARQHGQGRGAVPHGLFLRRYLQPRRTRLANARAVGLLRTDHLGSREPTPFALSRQRQRRQLARNADRRRHPVPAIHRLPCRYQGVAHHQRGICHKITDL